MEETPAARRVVESRDIVQSALRSGMRHIGNFRGESESELLAWLRSILRTKVHRIMRRKEHHIGLEELARERGPLSIQQGVPPLCAAVRAELLRELREAVCRLPLESRLVVETVDDFLAELKTP